MTSNDRLLSEFIDAWNAGERPRALEWLARVPAGPQRDELADQLSAWAEAAPLPPPATEAVRDEVRRDPAVARALLLAGLPAERERARLTLAELAGRLVRVLGLPERAAPAAERHLERLEAGRSEGRGPTRRLLDALAEALDGPVTPARPAVAFRGTAAEAATIDRLQQLTDRAMGAPEPEDELARLFSAGPGG